MYRSYISIPGNRAVRVTYEDERLLDDEGKLCLNASAGNNTLKEGIDDNLVELNTTVKYKDDATKTVYGSNNTMSLKDINGQNFTVIGLARYNNTIVLETTFQQVERIIEGTMVTLCETNPNASIELNGPNDFSSDSDTTDEGSFNWDTDNKSSNLQGINNKLLSVLITFLLLAITYLVSLS